MSPSGSGLAGCFFSHVARAGRRSTSNRRISGMQAGVGQREQGCLGTSSFCSHFVGILNTRYEILLKLKDSLSLDSVSKHTHISPETFLLPPFSIRMLFATETPKINGGAHYKKKFGDIFLETDLCNSAEVVRKVPAFPLERFFLLGQQKKRFFFSRFFFFSFQPNQQCLFRFSKQGGSKNI